jgi:hypothetical protein
MANGNLEIKVDVTGLNVPLMIIVDDAGKTRCWQHGVKVENMRSISFSASLNEQPVTNIEQNVR